MRPLLLVLAILAFLGAPSAPAAADDPAASGADPVGRAAAVEGQVTATLGADQRRVLRGEAVYQGDWIETAEDARAKIVLADSTELVVGPASRIHLDEFVYDPGKKGGKVLIEMGVGLMRFTSGTLAPESYQVNTPVASIGVRGTIFDTLVAAVTFATTVILRDGKISIKTLVESSLLDKEDHASSAESSSDEPEDQRPATDEEEELADPLKKPFKDELPFRPNIPIQRPSLDPSQHVPSTPSVPSQPNIPQNIPRGPRY
jgi:hypothetical protein